MEKKYYVKEFAKIANVSERTIRYYDSIGLLKPSFKLENGYRVYTREDLLKLQQILILKQLDFNLKDIMPIILSENKDGMKEFFHTQLGLLDKKITHLQKLKKTMEDVKKMIEHKEVDWENIQSLIQISNAHEAIVNHYKDTNHLSTRILLHKKYSINPIGWFAWIYEKLNLTNFSHIIEIGCGNGELWNYYRNELKDVDVFISDLSSGMVDEVKKYGPKEFHYMTIDINNIPFKDAYFDCMIANHVLFYIEDLDTGLCEIQRVLQENGAFYCTTYGKHHMKEITELVREFDDRIQLSKQNLYDKFGLDNGKEILQKYFSTVTRLDYHDALEVDKAQPIFDYIMSCHGNQVEIIGNRLNEFKLFIESKIKDKKVLRITKQAGLFICRK